MTPVDMISAHDPPHSYGDCYRACVASVLDMKAEDVPHFFEDAAKLGDCLGEVGHTRLTDFLRPLGMYPVGLKIKADDWEWFDALKGYYILGGQSPRAGHFVVAKGRAELVHDPHPTDKCGITPDEDGTYVVMLFVRLL